MSSICPQFPQPAKSLYEKSAQVSLSNAQNSNQIRPIKNSSSLRPIRSKIAYPLYKQSIPSANCSLEPRDNQSLSCGSPNTPLTPQLRRSHASRTAFPPFLCFTQLSSNPSHQFQATQKSLRRITPKGRIPLPSLEGHRW